MGSSTIGTQSPAARPRTKVCIVGPKTESDALWEAIQMEPMPRNHSMLGTITRMRTAVSIPGGVGRGKWAAFWRQYPCGEGWGKPGGGPG